MTTLFLLPLLLALAVPPAASAQEEPLPFPALPPVQSGAAAPIPSGAELVLARHAAESGCEDPQSEHMRAHAVLNAELSATSTLYAVPCTASADNVLYRLYAHETGEIGGIRTLYFAVHSASHGWTGTDLLANVEAEGPRLTAIFRLDRSGTCGARAEWTWLAFDYRLDRLAVEEACRDRAQKDWPIVYPQNE